MVEDKSRVIQRPKLCGLAKVMCEEAYHGVMR